MEILLQLVAVKIILAVEVPGGLFFGAEHIVQLGQTDGPVHDAVRFIGADPTAFSPTDVVDMAPKALVQSAVVEKGAEIFHSPGGIPVGAVFQHIVKAVVEHDGVLDLAHRFSDDAGLPQGNPVFQSALDDQPLRRHLAHGIIVKHTGLDGVAHPAPVDGRHPVAGLGHCTDVDQPGNVLLAQLEDGPDDVLGGAIVGFHGLLGVVVRRRGHKGGDVQHQVAAPHALENAFIVGQISPCNLQPRVCSSAPASA